MKSLQYYVKVYPNTKPSNDMHDGGYERRCREACHEIRRQIVRHVDNLETQNGVIVGVTVEWEETED